MFRTAPQGPGARTSQAHQSLWSPQGSIDHFVETRAKTEDFLRTTPGLRDHAIDSPGDGKYGKWDAYEFVLLITAHSERHTNQIKEVKADPNFPKN
jgi:hypothetical protein